MRTERWTGVFLGAVVAAVFVAGCGVVGGGGTVVEPTVVVVPADRGGVVVSAAEMAVMVPALTHEASERRRIREEHEGLIRSLPPSPEPTPTLDARERQKSVGARLAGHGGGLPPAVEVLEGWFDPDVGLSFARRSGGDWTSRVVRENHGYRGLVYFEGYPEGIPNFYDGSLQKYLARELAFGAWRVMPMLGEPTPVLVDIIAGSIGWEVRNAPGAVVNVWSDFVLVRDEEEHRLVLGGVMRMSVMSHGEGDGRMDYLVPGSWIGSVVVERVE